MNIRVAIILPYYGKFPNYFSVWLKSVSYNQDFDFILVTDKKPDFELPDNVIWYQKTFESLKAKLQSYLDFNIVFDEPYKICDYRPLFGKIFQDILIEYEFWGHCDPDIILGDLSKFITNDILDNYDKIYSRGHLTLYRNNDINNNLYQTEHKLPILSYKDVFSTKYACHFDEWDGLSLIYKDRGLSCYDNVDFFDVDYLNYEFIDAESKSKSPKLILWQDGKIYSFHHGGAVADKVELAYVHLQKRGMLPPPVDLLSSEKYYIYPNGFCLAEESICISKPRFYALTIKYKDIISKIKNGYFEVKIKRLKLKLYKG